MARFSIIVPVYNRPAEVNDLLESLATQTYKDFEVIIVEDGSTVRCEDVCRKYESSLNLKYFYKSNEGRSIARNHGIENSEGEWLIFFDSDCVIPSDYFTILTHALEKEVRELDCYGGPDSAHDSFSTTQKAINYTMTSFLTTGGIRGGKLSMEKFTPRSFNMGFRRHVYEKIGGFREMFSEDIDISTRIKQAGFKIGLIHDAKVWHKRRVDFKKFMRQVYVFGMSRITLKLLYPESLKIVHTLPAVALICGVILVILGVVASPWYLLPIVVYLFMIWLLAAISTKSVAIATKAVPAAIIQIGGYGFGFIKAYFTKIILGRGRDQAKEIEMRKGK
jgi:glycosyltransferase involved in cell wall biosynthesis